VSTREPIQDDVLLLARRWWVMLLRGIFAFIFGFLVLAWPGVALATLVLCFGVYAFTDGVLSLFAAMRNWRHPEKCWLLGLEGFAGICAGAVTLWAPGVTAFMLLLLIAGWMMATGLLRIVAAIRVRHEIADEVWLMLSGLTAVLFGLILLVSPAGATALLWLLAAYGFLLGAFLIGMGFKMRRMRIIVYGGLYPVKQG
jgi:uncharacterized membrane protein HdeD (DUF308 family)